MSTPSLDKTLKCVIMSLDKLIFSKSPEFSNFNNVL